MISLSNIHKHYGQNTIFDGAALQINSGEKIGLVGPNGKGKTTLFRILTGEETVESGTVSIPDRCVLGYFSQDVGEMAGRSALDETVAGAGKVSELAQRIKDIEHKLEQSAITPLDDDEMMSLVTEYSEAQEVFERIDGHNLVPRAKAILTGLGIGPDDYHRPVESFSGGWKMRIALAKILLLNPDVLLMDEPTNHLDLESIEWLESWLREFKGALLMTSHDREFMNRLVSKIAEVSQKQIITYTGNYDFYEKERQIRREQLIAAAKKQQDMLAKEEEFIARFAARASHAAQVQSRVKKLDKIDRIEVPPDEQTMNLQWANAQRSGNDVAVLRNLGKTWLRDDGKSKTVFSGLSGVVRRGEKVAVTGVNGAGKSTLLKIITGQTSPTEGSVNLGTQLQMGYFSQHSLDVLNPKSSIYDEVYSKVPDASVTFVRGLLGAFLFSGEDVHKKIGILSGGEKSRVVLATILANPVNFLVLDEPTNHLDMGSREVLLRALQEYSGTLMIVSHDRHFLRHLVNRVFEIDHGQMNTFDGNYDEYRAKSTVQAH